MTIFHVTGEKKAAPAKAGEKRKRKEAAYVPLSASSIESHYPPPLAPPRKRQRSKRRTRKKKRPKVKRKLFPRTTKRGSKFNASHTKRLMGLHLNIRLEQKKAKLDDVYEKVMVQKKGRFSSFTEFLYGALRALGEPAELQSIYDWVAKNWKLLEPKCK